MYVEYLVKTVEYGTKTGALVVYFHGAPGAIKECAVFDKHAQENNTFSMGKLFNAVEKLVSRKVGTGERAAVINTAEKVSKVDRDRLRKRDGFSSGGSVKKYAMGGGMRKARTYG